MTRPDQDRPEMMQREFSKHDDVQVVGSKLMLKPQGALDGADGEMASELLGRLDEGACSKKRFPFFQITSCRH